MSFIPITTSFKKVRSYSPNPFSTEHAMHFLTKKKAHESRQKGNKTRTNRQARDNGELGSIPVRTQRDDESNNRVTTLGNRTYASLSQPRGFNLLLRKGAVNVQRRNMTKMFINHRTEKLSRCRRQQTLSQTGNGRHRPHQRRFH